MKKKLMHFLLLGAVFSMASCGNTIAPTTTTITISDPTTSGVLAEKEYYLTGDLDLGETHKLQFTKDGDTYTLSNVKLRRGNSFQIYEKDNILGFEHLSSSIGFKEGKNGYIQVMNEGIYNISILDGETISLTKTASSYSKVQLHVGEDKTYDFTMNDQFVYQLNDISLPYHESFYITLDEEHLSFNTFDYNDLYYAALRFNNDKVQVIQKGSYNFTLNFANDNALLVTSENLQLPQELPQDVDSYVNIVNSLTNQFRDEGSLFTLKESTYLAEDQTTSNIYYNEGITLNEHYYNETVGDDEDAYKLIRANILTKTNYYEITRYENSTNSPLFNGYLIGEQEEDTNTDKDSTIVKLDKNYLTLEKAKDRMLSLVGKEGTLKANLLSPTKVLHLASNEHNSTYDAAYYATAKITSSYANSVGDGMKIKASNTEKYISSFSSKAVTNSVEFTTDDLGHLTEGKLIISYYQGTNIFDEDENLVSTLSPYKTVTYEFSYEYNTREESKTFHIDLNKYLLSEVYMNSSITVTAGDTISNSSLPIIECEPLTAIDANKLQIVEFDSQYLVQGKGDKTIFTANKKGETSVKIGTLYSNKTYDVDVYIEYKDPSNISISPSVSYSSTFYVGATYNFTATISSSYADPAVDISVSDKSKIQLTVDDIDTQRKNGKANFSLKMLEASDSAITVTISSASKPSVSSKINISKILPALTIADVAGTYYYTNNSKNWTLTIGNDGQSNLSNDQKASYDFKIKMQGAEAILDSSETVDSFTAKKGFYNESENYCYLEISEFKLKDGTDVKKDIYTWGSPKFYEIWAKHNTFRSMKDEKMNATLELVSFTYSTSAPVANYKLTYGDVIYTFTWSPSNYGANGSFGSPSRNGDSSYGSVSISNLTENSFTLKVYRYNTFDDTFNFTLA